MRPPAPLRRAVRALVLSACLTGAAGAAVRLPVADGTYCGPENATIGIDSRADTVTIAGYTCGSPIFAADQLQSIQCRKGDDPPLRREFDVRVLDGALLYDGRWFRPCRP